MRRRAMRTWTGVVRFAVCAALLAAQFAAGACVHSQRAREAQVRERAPHESSPDKLPPTWNRDGLLLSLARVAMHDPTLQTLLLREVEGLDSLELRALALRLLPASKSLAIVGEETPLDGYTRPDAIVVSPDASQALQVTVDGAARLWSLETSEPVGTLSDECFNAAFSSDGRSIATLSSTGALAVWSTGDRRKLRELKSDASDVSRSGLIGFSPDGQIVWTTWRDHLRIWRWEREVSARTIATDLSVFPEPSFSNDSRLIAVATDDEGAVVHNTDGSGSPRVLACPGSIAVVSSRFSDDGRKVLLAGHERACLWNTDGSGKSLIVPAYSLGGHEVALSPDGRKLATRPEEATAQIQSVDGSAKPIMLTVTSTITQLAFTPDSRRVVVITDSDELSMWDANAPDDLPEWRSFTRNRGCMGSSLAFSPSGRTLITASAHSACVWDSQHKDEHGGVRDSVALHGHSTPITSFVFSQDERTIVTTSRGGVARVWSVAGPDHPRMRPSGSSLAFSPDGRKLTGPMPDGGVFVRSADGSDQGTTLLASLHDVRDVRFSPDGKAIAAASCSSVFVVANVDGRGEPVEQSLPAPRAGRGGCIAKLAFSPDGRQLAAGAADGVHLWNLDGARDPVLLPHPETVESLAFTHDGRALATGSEKIRIWNLTAPGAPCELDNPGTSNVRFSGCTTCRSSIEAIAFTPDDRNFVTAASSGDIRSWDAREGAPRLLFTDELVSGHPAFALNPDATKIAVSGGGGITRIWDLDGRSQEPVVVQAPFHVKALAFSADGSKLAIAANDGTRVWPVTADALRAALWRETPYCHPVELRQQLLGETAAQAAHGLARCRAEVTANR